MVQTRSYGEIARVCGNTRAARAVGMASNQESCRDHHSLPSRHWSGRQLVGYGGGLDIKTYLLELERRAAERGQCG